MTPLFCSHGGGVLVWHRAGIALLRSAGEVTLFTLTLACSEFVFPEEAHRNAVNMLHVSIPRQTNQANGKHAQYLLQ